MLRNQEVTQVWLDDPYTLESVVVAIANGACLVDICEGKDLVYSMVLKFFVDDSKRREVYELAVEAGKDRMRQEVLHEIRALSLSNVKDAFDAQGNLYPIHELPEYVSKSVKGFVMRQGKNGQPEVSFKFVDKTKALELLGKELGMFRNRTEVEVGNTLAELIGDSMPVIDAEATVKDDEPPPAISA